MRQRIGRLLQKCLGKGTYRVGRNLIFNIFAGIQTSTRLTKQHFIELANLLVGYLYRLIYLVTIKRQQASYYKQDEDMYGIFESFSRALNRTKEKRLPLFLGPLDKHIDVKQSLMTLVAESNWLDITWARNFIYAPSGIQPLLKSSFGLFLEKKLNARPFIYNVQLLRVVKSENHACTIKGLGSLYDPRMLGVKGLMVLRCTTVNKTEVTYQEVKSSDTGSTILTAGNVIELNCSTDTITFHPDHNEIDLLFFHALPSANDTIRVQQPGIDTIGPIKLWAPQVDMVPEIKIANKEDLLAPKQKGICGLNLGGGANILDDWVSLDTRYGYENTKNILPLWLTSKDALPFDNNTFTFVYSSHFLEHVNDAITENLLNESFRVLKPNGTIMLVVPNFEKAIEYYKRGSWEFAMNWGFGDSLFPRYSMNGIETNLENITAAMFTASTSIIATKGKSPAAKYIYDGVPYVSRQELREKLLTLNVKDFSRFIVGKIPPHADTREHVNAYTKQELETRLSEAGFTVVYPESEHMAPLRKSLEKGGYRNKWPFVSLTVAAVKAS